MKYLKKYDEFITEELKKIISKSSNTGRTKEIDWIYDEEPSNAKSPSSGILLRDKLRKEEFKDLMDKVNGMLPDYTIKHFQKTGKGDKIKKFLVTMNNLNYLKDMAKERDELRCEYCDKGPLVIYDINPGEVTPEMLSNPRIKINTKFKSRDGATCDHKEPQSKGGDKFDYNNLAIACEPCNKRKGNMTWDDWVEYMSKRPEKYTFNS